MIGHVEAAALEFRAHGAVNDEQALSALGKFMEVLRAGPALKVAYAG